MTINKDCYIKSIKKDFRNLYIIAAIVIGFIIGTYTCLIFRTQINQIIYAIISIVIMIPPAYAMIVGHILILCYTLLHISNLNKKQANAESCNVWIGLGCCSIAMLGLIMLLILEDLNTADKSIFMNQCGIITIAFMIADVIWTPFALAYARCKIDPKGTKV